MVIFHQNNIPFTVYLIGVDLTWAQRLCSSNIYYYIQYVFYTVYCGKIYALGCEFLDGALLHRRGAVHPMEVE